MRFREFKHLLQEMSISSNELQGMKDVLASKIKELPEDDATAKALKEIEELLQHVNSGGRMGIIYDQLEKVNDPTVLAAQKMLARYLLSIDGTPEQRKELFSLWKSDKIVNLEALLSKKQQTFSDIFNGYDSNTLIKEFVDDLMEVSALGQGRGEFGLNVLSKSIWAPEDKKGDLQMRVGGRVMKIECKTTFGGAARFSDQEVRPAEGYEAAAVALNNFVKKNKTYPVTSLYPKGFPAYGLNIAKAIELYQNVTSTERSELLDLINNVVTLIFGGKGLEDDVTKIIKSIKAGDSGAALQAWAQASFNYYIGRKDDDGVLYTDLINKTFFYYEEASDLEGAGLRFHASTPYLSTVKDPGRGAYPQLEIIPTTYGADAAKKAMPKISKKKTEEEVMAEVTQWATAFANRRGVTDQETINSMVAYTREMLLNKTDSATIISELEDIFPQLKPKAPSSIQPQAQAQPQPAPKAAPQPQAQPVQQPVQQPKAPIGSVATKPASF